MVLAHMTWVHQWELGDPAKAYERIEAMEQRRKPTMTQDQSEEVESLLEGWYRWAKAQREFLGHSRVSPMFRDADAGDVHDDGDDVDARLHAVTSEMVDTCLSELTTMQRAAIDVHLRNKMVGVSIHRNPRLGTITEQHAAYQRAKDVLLPLLIRKGLVKRA